MGKVDVRYKIPSSDLLWVGLFHIFLKKSNTSKEWDERRGKITLASLSDTT
jgi:hypothetical protein